MEEKKLLIFECLLFLSGVHIFTFRFIFIKKINPKVSQFRISPIRKF